MGGNIAHVPEFPGEEEREALVKPDLSFVREDVKGALSEWALVDERLAAGR
jgi:hypothetical protein